MRIDWSRFVRHLADKINFKPQYFDDAFFRIYKRVVHHDLDLEMATLKVFTATAGVRDALLPVIIPWLHDIDRQKFVASFEGDYCVMMIRCAKLLDELAPMTLTDVVTLLSSETRYNNALEEAGERIAETEHGVPLNWNAFDAAASLFEVLREVEAACAGLAQALDLG